MLKATGNQRFIALESWDLVKFVMCALVSRVHMMFYTLRKGYTVPGKQGPDPDHELIA